MRIRATSRLGLFPSPESATTARHVSAAVSRTPKVLVLLGCYNGAMWIRRQLESILLQVGVDLVVVVRDDGSGDGTVQEIKRFQGDRRVQLCVGCPPTGSAAQNFLALIRDNSADEFEFVAFADQDDTWHRDKLARGCHMLSDSPLAAGYSSATVAIWPDGRTAVLTQSTRPTSADFLFEGAGQGCTYVLRRDFYARVRAFAIQHRRLTERVRYHDWMVYALARAWSHCWQFDRSPSMCYRQHEQNDTGARWTRTGLLRRFARLRRGWYREQLMAIASICAIAAPVNPEIQRWIRLLLTTHDLQRRVRIALFCVRAGGARRRRLDNLIIAAVALAGWL